MNILVVEDDPIDMKLLCAVLTSDGHLVQEKISAEDAAEAISARAPEVILLDLRLPGMDGLELTRLLKGDPGTHRIPIVAITAFPDRFTRGAAFAAGCGAYILKPIDTRTLSGLIERAAIAGD